MKDLGRIIKAYDIRGVVPDDWDIEEARALGAAFAALMESEWVAQPARQRAIAIGRDMRDSGVALAQAFADGVHSLGWNTITIGLASTDELYFASGQLAVPGAMFTASHNPAHYNGIKLCRAGAVPVGQDSGLDALSRAETVSASATAGSAASPGVDDTVDVLPAYRDLLHSLVPLGQGRSLRVVVDAGNGMAGLTAPIVLAVPGLELIPMYFELDGSFPHHEANPIDPKNLVDLQAAVREHNADIGLAFDGDADRCFVVDERGVAVSPSAITGLIARRLLAVEPGATIIHNLITSRSVVEVVREAGGTPVRTRVGHSFIKAEMARTNAVFGGEHSGHYYFRDFWRADSGMLAALHVLAELAEAAQPLSTLMAQYERYSASGEINSVVADVPAVLDRVAETFASEGASIDHLDGLTVQGPQWWFNLRPSNTEPLLRLNAEAGDPDMMGALRDRVLGLVEEASR